MCCAPSAQSKLCEGFITLIAILIAGAIAVTIATFLLLLGLDASRTSAVLEESGGARALADACAEEALQILNENNFGFSGSGALAIAPGNCTYLISKMGTQTLVESTGTILTITRHVRINLTKAKNQRVVVSWQEVGN